MKKLLYFGAFFILLFSLVSCGCKHEYNGWVTIKEPTCTEPGTKMRTCAKCDHVEYKEIPAAGHNYNANGVCTVCGDIRS